MALQLTSPKHFQYSFLDKFSRYVPEHYALIDTAIDLVGYQLHPSLYPKSPANFSTWANVPPGKGPEAQSIGWRIRQPKFPDLYDTDGIDWRLSKETRNGAASASPPPKDIVLFRRKAFSSVYQLVRSGALSPFFFGSDALIEHSGPIGRAQFQVQRDLIQNTGCMWTSDNLRAPSLVLAMFKRSELASAIGASEAGNQKRELIEAARKENIEVLMGSVLRFCSSIDEKISRKGLWYVLRELLGPSSRILFIDPSGSTWRRACNKVYAELLSSGEKSDSFCAAGNPCIIGKNQAYLDIFVSRYLQVNPL